MQEKIFRCSYLINSRIDNLPTAYADDNIMINVKDIFAKSRSELMHTHNFFEFDLVLCGCGHNISSGGEVKLERGHIVFGTPANLHSIGADDGSTLTVANIEFVGKAESLVMEALDTIDGFVLKLSDEDFEFVCSELDSILSLSLTDKGRMKMFVKGAVMKILSVIAEAYASSAADGKRQGTDSKVQDALLYIRKNYNRQLKAEEVAKYVGYSADYLSSLIKRSTRMTFSDYLLTLRLENAYLLLMENEKTIQQICMEVGYSSYPNFYYAFKKRFGIAPGEVTKRSRKENSDTYYKKGGHILLEYDENNNLIWR